MVAENELQQAYYDEDSIKVSQGQYGKFVQATQRSVIFGQGQVDNMIVAYSDHSYMVLQSCVYDNNGAPLACHYPKAKMFYAGAGAPIATIVKAMWQKTKETSP